MIKLDSETALEAIQFAEEMIQDGVWTAGRSHESFTAHKRAKEIVTEGEVWRLQRLVVEREGGCVEGIDDVLSGMALELSDLARKAIENKSFKITIDPWVLTSIRNMGEEVALAA